HDLYDEEIMPERHNHRCARRRYCLAGLLLLASATAAPAVHAQTTSHVIVNGQRLSPVQLRALELKYRVRTVPGRYWYDRSSGAWGIEGGPTAGLIVPGLALGGPLRADASRGTTLVWVNGRRLPWQDLVALQQLTGPIQPGRYWLDARGNAGFERGPALVNLQQLANRGRRSAWSSYTRNTDASVGGDGSFFYYIDRTSSATGGH
ncbi:MAG: hypothetical protein ACRERX_21230, partial [Pseudomonas sp.]